MEKDFSNALKREIISWIKVVASAVIFALCVNNFVIVNAKVPTGSMEDTIMSNDRIVAFRLAYVFSEPKRFDVVVFRYPDDESVLYVKRIVGLPGETLQVCDGKIYINGSDEPLDDSFVKNIPIGDTEVYHIPEDCYFMMGDNRNNSKDSRYWTNTFLEKDKILGEVIFKYYPGFEVLLNK